MPAYAIRLFWSSFGSRMQRGQAACTDSDRKSETSRILYRHIQTCVIRFIKQKCVKCVVVTKVLILKSILHLFILQPGTLANETKLRTFLSTYIETNRLPSYKTGM